MSEYIYAKDRVCRRDGCESKQVNLFSGLCVEHIEDLEKVIYGTTAPGHANLQNMIDENRRDKLNKEQQQ